MKKLKIVGLGVFIWSLSWLWPEINQFLTPRVMVGAVIGLGIIYLLHLRQRQQGEISTIIRAPMPVVQTQGADTRPLKPIGLA